LRKKRTAFSKLINILALALISILSLLSLSLYKNNINRNKSNSLLHEKKRVDYSEKAEKLHRLEQTFINRQS
jgi:hypothetical protein